MSRRSASLPPDYFTNLYAADVDPWEFATSPYEKAKYAATLASLPRARYENALEIGCSIGVLTQRLADRCDRLTALDVVPAVLEAARARCRDEPHVECRLAAVPSQWPAGSFDLILLSEVIYYLDAADLTALVERVSRCLRPAGDVVLVHWLGETDYPHSGDEAAESFIRQASDFSAPIHQARTEAYRLDVLRAASRKS